MFPRRSSQASLRNVAGVIDENIDAGGFVCQPMKIVRFAQIHGMRNDVDLVSGAQAFGQCSHRLGAARRKMQMLPSSANASAIAAPMPFDAPVISTFFPRR